MLKMFLILTWEFSLGNITVFIAHGSSSATTAAVTYNGDVLARLQAEIGLLQSENTQDAKMIARPGRTQLRPRPIFHATGECSDVPILIHDRMIMFRITNTADAETGAVFNRFGIAVASLPIHILFQFFGGCIQNGKFHRTRNIYT